MEPKNPEDHPESQALFTNNFWLRLTDTYRDETEEGRDWAKEKGRWTEEDERDYQVQKKLFNDIDQITLSLGIDKEAIVSIMRNTQELGSQAAEQQLAPIFEALLAKGYDPKELMK